MISAHFYVSKMVNGLISTKIKQGKLYKKYNLRCNYCGTDIFMPFFLLKIRYIFTDTQYVSCPKCHKTSCYRFMSNIIHDSVDKKEKAMNKKNQWDKRIR